MPLDTPCGSGRRRGARVGSARLVTVAMLTAAAAITVVATITGPLTDSAAPWLGGIAVLVAVTTSLWGWTVRVHAIGWIVGLTAVAIVATWTGPTAALAALVWLIGVADDYLFVPAADAIDD